MTTLMRTSTATLPVSYIMQVWRPGSYETAPDGTLWTWADEIADLRKSGELQEMAHHIVRFGKFSDPVLLGGDGRVWDGHHRIIAAYMKGVLTLPVEFGFV